MIKYLDINGRMKLRENLLSGISFDLRREILAPVINYVI